MGKSSGTNSTVTQTSAPNPQFQQAYQGAVTNAQNLAAQPYQQYPGGTSSLLAPLQPYQNAAIGEIAGAQGMSQPLLNTAAADFNKAATPITATPFSTAAVNQYLSPYTQDVTSSLQNLFNQQNATQQSQVTGNAAAEAAFGGDRSAVAAALTAGQQQAQEAPVLAQNLQTGYNTALGEFNAQQQANLQAQQATGWLEQGAGYGQANLGQEAQNLYLSGANALLGAGGLQQQQAQEGLNIPYEQFIAQESYPYQMAGWEANIAEGLGGASGGTSSTQYPGPSALSQVAGLGLTGTGLLGATGAFGSTGYLTGAGGLFSGVGGVSDAAAASGLADAGALGGDAAIGAGLGDAGILGDAALLAARRGGRIPRQGGGALTTPYNTGLQLPGMANPTTGAPQLPNLATGYLPTPPPSPGASRTMPTGAGMGQQQQQQPVQQALQTLAALKGIKGLFPGDSPDTPAAAMGGAVTLATPYQGYDDGGAPILQAGQAATGGASPLSQGMIQQYMQLPMEQLQELAQRSPPQTPQGQAIQRALQMKKMNPGSAIGGAGALTPPMSPQGMGVTPAPVGPATSALSPTLATAWKGGRIKRDAGGDIPGLAVAPDSPLLTSPLAGTGEPSLASPDLGAPGVSLATGPGANVATQKGNESPQSVPLPPKTTPASASGAGLAAPSPAAAPSLANPPSKTGDNAPSTDPLAGVMAHIAQPESGGRNVLYGGAPVPPGNVIPGAIGPTGQQTHAFSKYQFEPGTWNDANAAAKAQGHAPLDKDNPQDVEWAGRYTARNTYGIDQNGHNLDQAAAAGAVYYSRLAKTWPSLAPHSGSTGKPSLATGPNGGGQPSGGAMMAPVTDAGPAGGTTSDASANIEKAIALLHQNQNIPQGNFYNSPWMPLVAAGAGILASRSPFPGVALGEGLETGLKELGGQQAAIPENQLKQAQAASAGIPLYQTQVGIETAKAVQDAEAAAGAGPPAGVVGSPPPSIGQQGAAPSAGGVVPSGGGQPTPLTGGQQQLPSGMTEAQQAAVADVNARIAPLRIERARALATNNPTAAASYEEQITRIMQGSPDYLAAQAAAKGWADVGPHAAAAGAAKAAELPSTITSNRAGSIPMLGTTPLFAVPTPRPTTDPNTGQPSEQYFTPPLPVPAGQPGAAPSTGGPVGETWPAGVSTPTKNQMEIEKEGLVDAKKGFGAAQDIKFRLGMMDRAIDTLNQAGWSATGPGANTRIGAARAINTFFTNLNQKPPFDPEKVASWEDLNKETTRAGFDLARTLGSREAMMIVQSATAAVPNAGNTAMGAHLVSSSLNQAAQRQEDYYNFLNSWGDRNAGRMHGADIAFNEQHPPESYVMRAVGSVIPPQAVDMLKGNHDLAGQFDAKYGPGMSQFMLGSQ